MAQVVTRGLRITPRTYDAERKNTPESGRSAEFYIGLLIAMLLWSSVVGFVLGIATFITLFLRRAAELVWWKAIAGGGGFILFLDIISHQFTLRYPKGLLQNFISFPWPLQ